MGAPVHRPRPDDSTSPRSSSTAPLCLCPSPISVPASSHCRFALSASPRTVSIIRGELPVSSLRLRAGRPRDEKKETLLSTVGTRKFNNTKHLPLQTGAARLCNLESLLDPSAPPIRRTPAPRR
ncbi:hypothetical protein CCHR01_13200 [Colletotrichum chrysophilum]|uniref:Uncharacterized protein n=1 Tax=Colletotrichum chrysophilum TaxID=1836956 RepID=A0AAD9AAZ0_9PEZI|nr:hypothetical protein CCHR01_13200 [Colletotrichum chrysophilum]